MTGSLRRPKGWRRRIALAVLFALQGAITVSPLLEPKEARQPGAHVEQQGAQHKYQHDDSTCALCRVLSLHSSPAHGGPAIASERENAIAALDTPVSTVRHVDPTALPRAPPSLS